MQLQGSSITQPASQERLPLASLIICSRNRPALLEEAVSSILRGAEVPADLIIVDQSDQPNPRLAALAAARPDGVRYLCNRSVGLSRANNVGVRAARHELLVFTHDDIIAPPTWFGAIVRALVAAGPSSVITGQVLPTDPERPGAVVPTVITDESEAVYEGRIGRDVLFPLNMAMYKNAIEKVGPFDERLGPGTPFPGGEDNDFGLRLLDANFRIIYAPSAALYHRAWRAEPLRLRWGYGRGQGAFFAKHLSFRDRYVAKRLVRATGHYLLRALRRSRRDVHAALGDVLYVAGMLSGTAEWLITYRGAWNRPGRSLSADLR